MRVICSFSGVSFTCSAFPGFIAERAGYVHPAHFASLASLSRSVSLFTGAPERFTGEEITLLFSSLLNHTGLVSYEIPLPPGVQASASFLIPSLWETLSAILEIPHASRDKFLPHVSTYQNPDWKAVLEDWREGISAYHAGHVALRISEKLSALSERISVLSAKRDAASISKKLNSLAEWASIAAEFPAFETIHPHTSLPVSCAVYWKELIRACHTSSTLLNYPREDINELLDHCYEKLAAGDFLSGQLFATLENAIQRRESFLHYGAEDFPTSISAAGQKIIFAETLMKEDSEKEAAALASLRESAPEREPQKADYPNALAFLKAKLAYAASQKGSLYDSSKCSSSV